MKTPEQAVPADLKGEVAEKLAKLREHIRAAALVAGELSMPAGGFSMNSHRRTSGNNRLGNLRFSGLDGCHLSPCHWNTSCCWTQRGGEQDTKAA